jgi:2-polyprenyl-3-methyl-5-hydroxy-6-metoxy-1,4-benzoquinol methylase
MDGNSPTCGDAACPLCGRPSVHRIHDRLHRCRRCGIAFNAAHRPLDYSDTYFTDEYRAQYGRTYLEDYPAIYAASQRRLAVIFSMLKNTAQPRELSLLDIGSAMGFFLKAAADRGVGRISGIEISSYAAGYCEKVLGIAVEKAPFDPERLSGDHDIITAWFFVEHCADPAAALAAMAARVRPGGVLAFSAPSIQGPLFRFSRKAWAESHPADHRVDFSPRAARRLMKKLGFARVRVIPAGFHPERVITPDSPFFRFFVPVYRIIVRLLAFSDTIEVYAQK